MADVPPPAPTAAAGASDSDSDDDLDAWIDLARQAQQQLGEEVVA